MENDSSIKYLKAWLNLSANLNLQWNDSSLRKSFIRRSNKELCNLYHDLFLNLNLKNKNPIKGYEVECQVFSKYGLLRDVNNGTNSTDTDKFPFRIHKNSTFGRHLVSNRRIEAGEVLLIENQIACGPIVHFPCTKEIPCCIQCFSEACTYLCPKCGFFLCRTELCKKRHISNLECTYLSSLGLVNEQKHIHNLEDKDFRDIIMKRPFQERKESCQTISDAYVEFIKQQKQNILKYYPAIPSLNLLCILEKCKTIEGLILSLQGDVTPGSRRYKVNQKHIVNVIKLMKLPYSEDFVHKMAAIWDTNAFQSEDQERKYQVMFVLSSLFTHSCKPNCENIFMKGFQAMIFRAVKDIPKGTVLTISYTDPFWPTYIRRDHLQVSKNFICECRRCQDLTEYGTFTGHSLCDSCKTFSLCASVSKEHYKALVCSSCNNQINSAKFFIIEAAACNLLSNFKVSNLKTYEEVVSRLGQTFKNRYHDNHYIFQRIRLALFLEHSVQELSELCDEDLQKMMSLISELLKFCSAILPRLSRRKAQVSKEFIRYMEELNSRHIKSPLRYKEIETMKEECDLVLSW